ncbi:gfo/Idh/MocA family oxidoreductase [Phytoactinopolyspora sp. XMNu-373]|uniref:Gfo/Idh/MocA family oxidoreductase n=2 Tax=Phytoactinopolyspora mesophila TaxID=2650750 RepID=A0A7K3MCG4_9ACTN|nr:Gfo/Idh/MocA family oxidoreductase [Phytoactinopolyspora mesophila]NDL60956.1 gfo/Idh/MocA family oxidoreductase [Phytoactinopolyspora mesophila]
MGIVGCGNISAQYLRTLTSADETSVVAVADLDADKAAHAAATYGARAFSVDEIFGVDEIEWILNLTTPAAHEDVSLAAIGQGLSVYNEKPLCATVAAAQRVLEAAHAAGVAVGSAPDTVLGTGLQTARATLASGAIGRPVFATATMAVPGHELWHPAPDFYYAPGGGPLLDMGPYYLTALVTLLGPVAAVYGAASRTRDERIISSGPRKGERIGVAVDSHITAICEHASGALTTLIMSFDAAASQAARIEVHGEEGSMAVPDPNEFHGAVQVHSVGGTWEMVTPSAGYTGAGRGLGLIDIARSADRRTGRASAELGFHVLDVMSSILRSADDGQRRMVSSTCTVPDPVPLTELSYARTGGAGQRA